MTRFTRDRSDRTHSSRSSRWRVRRSSVDSVLERWKYGRSRVYEAIVKGQNLPEPGIPESFNVLVQELKALGIHVSMGANVTSGYGLGNQSSTMGNNGNGSEE